MVICCNLTETGQQFCLFVCFFTSSEKTELKSGQVWSGDCKVEGGHTNSILTMAADKKMTCNPNNF